MRGISDREPVGLEHEAVSERFRGFRLKVRVAEGERLHLLVVGREAWVNDAVSGALCNNDVVGGIGVLVEIGNTVATGWQLIATRIGKGREALVARLEEFEHARRTGGFVEDTAETQPLDRGPFTTDLVGVDAADGRVVRTAVSQLPSRDSGRPRLANVASTHRGNGVLPCTGSYTSTWPVSCS